MATEQEINKTDERVARGAHARAVPGAAQGRRRSGRSRAKYVNVQDDGMYRCAACGDELFDSDTKFDSGTGWPSFPSPPRRRVETRADNSLFMRRTEVVCRRCGSHLGHVFDDGPRDRAASATASTRARSSSRRRQRREHAQPQVAEAAHAGQGAPALSEPAAHARATSA